MVRVVLGLLALMAAHSIGSHYTARLSAACPGWRSVFASGVPSCSAGILSQVPTTNLAPL
jgi:hypothetical protein